MGLTDLATLSAILTRAGVRHRMERPFTSDPADSLRLVIEADSSDSERPRGYGGFRADFYFTANGELCDVGIWE